jgi:hypothetical protein
MKLIAIAVAASTILFANSTCADTPFNDTFGRIAGGAPCYFRVYDADHMTAHRHQTVTGIFIDYSPGEDASYSAASFELSFGFRLKRSEEWFAGPATCKASGAHFSCSLEGDGGLFTLTPGKPGGLQLAVVNRGGTGKKDDQINLEGTNSFAGFGKPGGDDLVFVLPRIDRSACDSKRL